MSSQTRFSTNTTLGLEPRLSDVLKDPVIHAVMARDGVTEDELRSVILCAQRNLRAA